MKLLPVFVCILALAVGTWAASTTAAADPGTTAAADPGTTADAGTTAADPGASTTAAGGSPDSGTSAVIPQLFLVIAAILVAAVRF